jgi:hypothetical protein
VFFKHFCLGVSKETPVSVEYVAVADQPTLSLPGSGIVVNCVARTYRSVHRQISRISWSRDR